MVWTRNDGADERLREIRGRFKRVHNRFGRRRVRSLRPLGKAIVLAVLICVLAAVAFRDRLPFGLGDDARIVVANLIGAKPTVIDGDTIRWKGQTVRLVGFD